MAKLDSRQTVPLTSEELELLRAISITQEITTGLYARALLTWALHHAGDPGIMAAVEAARADAAGRLSAGAREAVAHRWEK